MIEEKERLIKKVKYLMELHNIKQNKYSTDPEIGCITRETVIIASLLPQLEKFNINLSDIIKEQNV